MAANRDLDDSEGSDDSISLTSTVASDSKEDYEVDCILAERKSKGVVEYLTAWKGYPETEHQWLLRDDFNEGPAFDIWTDTKRRVADGLEKPFDVKAWTKRCKVVRTETSRRKERRRAKRLQFTEQDDVAPGPEDHDANIESSGSDFAPRQSDKRIKRRSVHQDSPPSSSTSVPPSGSNSEDSDRPLTSRQESEISTPNSKWTQGETMALEEGLQKKGPRWREILGLYGHNGTISQVLKAKSPGDLYDKAKSVRQEFIDSGRDPPEYLKTFSRTASLTGSRTATPNVHSESRGQSRAVSKKSSRSTSADSMMAELHRKQRTREAKNRENRQPEQGINSTEGVRPAKGRERESNTAKKMSADKPKTPRISQSSARREEVASAFEILKGNPQSAHSKPQAGTVASNTDETEDKGNNNNSSRHNKQPEDRSRANEPSQNRASSPGKQQTKSQTPSAKGILEAVPNAAAQPEHSHTIVPDNNESMQEETARPNWSGTAKTTTARPSVSNPSRLGAVGIGPSRPRSSKVKPKLGQIQPKKPVMTGDVTAAWNAEPKQRKSNNWATTNADPVGGQPTKRAYKLSVQNKIFKSRRDGRAPDPNLLVFIDPKTGKAPTAVPTPVTSAMISKTPLQLHQEELAAREAEERQSPEIDDAMLISTSQPDPPPPIIDQNRETPADERTVSGTGWSISNASKSRPTIGDMSDGQAHINTLTPPPAASPQSAFPLEIPLGPRNETRRLSKVPLTDYLKRSVPSAPPLDNAVIHSDPPISEGRSRFNLRIYPSREHKNEIFTKAEQNLVIGNIKLEENAEEEGIKVRFVGFDFEVRRLLLTIKRFPRTAEFMFKTVCLASEYKVYFPAEPSDYLGSGSILSYSESASAVENIVETLANNLQGGLFFAQQYTMLMYPAGASAWAFLDDKLPSVHPGTALRFAVRKPLPPIQADVHGLATAQLTKDVPERYTEITTKVEKNPILPEEKSINIVFRDMFDIEFGRLVAQSGDQLHLPTNIFFLCFIPQGCENYEPDPAKRSALRMRTSEEHDLFIKFLQANGAEEIYSMQDIGSQDINNSGAWDYFCKSVKSGTIVFHDAFIRYDLIPHLAKHLLRGSINVWKTSLSPMHPGEKHPHLVRLFPHGGVLLLTESLFLYRPLEALRILMWFRRDHVPWKPPGTWKVAVRPRVREWLLDIMDAYTDSGKDIFGCSIQIFANIYTEIHWLLQKTDSGDAGLMCHEWDYEIPTDEAPMVSSSSLRDLQSRKEWKGEGADTEPDDNNIKKNDDLLAQWFAEWAIVNLHNFRKYHIILGYTKDDPFTRPAISDYEKAWGHIEVMTSEEAFKRHNVTAQSVLDENEAKRRRKVKEQLPAKKAAAAKARKEEREAAKLALDARMQTFRDVGATDEEVVRAGRQLLRDRGGSEREVEECRVDMDRVFMDRWWEGEGEVKDGEANKDDMDTTEARP